MNRDRFTELVEVIRSGSDASEEAEELLNREASHEDISRLEALLQDSDNLLREAVAVPYARLVGPKGLENLLRAYQQDLGPYGSESETIQNLLMDTVESDTSLRILEALTTGAEDAQLRDNAAWLIELSRSESLETPLAEAPPFLRSISSKGSDLQVVVGELSSRIWKVEFARVQAYRRVGGDLFRPLTRGKPWLVRLFESRWSQALLSQAHMHPHPHPGQVAHYQLGTFGNTIDVLSSGCPEFTDVQE